MTFSLPLCFVLTLLLFRSFGIDGGSDWRAIALISLVGFAGSIQFSSTTKP